MRKILFRGKMKYLNLPHKKGEWVYGNYVEFKDGDRTIHFIYGYGEVIPETVGRYIGLTDKNGVKIFEGDIVKMDGIVYVIIWDNSKAMFFLQSHKPRISTDFYYIFPEDLEVIGNIYDNPELLKARTE